MRSISLRQLAIAISTLFFSVALSAQNFSFNCTRDTTIAGCSPNPCFTLKGIVPDIHGFTTSYTLNSMPAYGSSSCFPVYSNPDIPGNPTNLTIDDRYTSVIDIGFLFPFYGSTYSDLIASTNGLISFDVSKANLFAHWNIISGGAPQDLPTTFYDRAIIMGPYHDLNPAYTTSPGQRIQYVTVGAAPYRKWILSFFKVPLFSTSCQNLIENTHQMILYESTGIIEVSIFSKEVCANWNQGRAMVGIQNYDRDQAMMAPGRRASDAPWGSIGMNETWRFVPAGGPSLFRRVELYNLAGTLLATGTTTNLNNGTLEASFPNICPPGGTTTSYIIKSFYTKIDNPAVEIFGADTVRVTKGPPSDLNATATSSPSACGPPSGSITVTVPTGTAPYTYVLDGGLPVTGPSPYTFTGVAAGPHTIVVTDASGVCNSTVIHTVTQNSNLTANLTPTATACPGVNNGSIAVTPTNGTGPYTFLLNPSGATQVGNTATFTNLAPGSYNVTITDATGCSTSPPLTVTVTTGAALTAATSTAATSCLGAANGSVTVTPGNGTGPYTFVLDGTVTQSGTTTTFNNLSAGSHNVVVTDAAGCMSNTITINIAAGPPLTTTSSHTDALCNGSATGTITVTPPAGGVAPFQYSLDGVTWQSSNVFTGLAQGTYTIRFRETNGCQGQLTETIGQPSTLSATAATTAAICNGQSNGIIIIASSGGVAPYQYSIDGGTTWQNNNAFNVPAGSYTVIVRDNNNCATTQLLTVTEPAALTATAATTDATCNGGNDGTITITANGGNTSYEYSINGTSFQSSNTFSVAPGTYTGTVKDNLGCITTIPNIVVGLTNDLTYTPPSNPTICEGTSTQLQISSNALQYAWSPATGLSSATVYNPTANPTVTTNYTVTLTYGRCTADVPVTVNVNAAPIPDAGADGYICYGQTYQLQASGGTDFRWTPSTYLDNPNIASPVSTPDKTTTYTLSVTDANGCNSLVTDEMKVDVTPPINVKTFPFDTVAYSGDQFTILATSAATDYLWTPATGLSNPNISNPVVTAGAIGDVVVYKVTAFTIAGCKGDGYVRVQVYKGPDLYVPTGFTPNGDGKNDKFFPFPVGIKEIKSFRVYNRWGQLIFSTTRLNDGWDGKFGGKEQASGVYIWAVEGITKDNRLITKKGTVTLIR